MEFSFSFAFLAILSFLESRENYREFQMKNDSRVIFIVKHHIEGFIWMFVAIIIFVVTPFSIHRRVMSSENVANLYSTLIMINESSWRANKNSYFVRCLVVEHVLNSGSALSSHPRAFSASGKKSSKQFRLAYQKIRGV